jgi:hypothetical protein
MPIALTDHTTCPGLGLLGCKLQVNPAAVSDVLVLNEHNTNISFSRTEGMVKFSS